MEKGNKEETMSYGRMMMEEHVNNHTCSPLPLSLKV
jgi:hypothetical protein